MELLECWLLACNDDDDDDRQRATEWRQGTKKFAKNRRKRRDMYNEKCKSLFESSSAE